MQRHRGRNLFGSLDRKRAGGVEATEQQEGEKKGGRAITGAMQGLGIKRSHGVLRARKRSNLE